MVQNSQNLYAEDDPLVTRNQTGSNLQVQVVPHEDVNLSNWRTCYAHRTENVWEESIDKSDHNMMTQNLLLLTCYPPN